jgi:hypothetical protein
MRTPPAFKQADVTKALKAARAAGLDVARTEISADGRIVLVHKLDASLSPADAALEAWRAKHDANSA